MSYIRGPYAKAATTFLDEIKRLGCIGGVGYDSRKRNRTLIVVLHSGDPSALPSEWMGFKVKASNAPSLPGGPA